MERIQQALEQFKQSKNTLRRKESVPPTDTESIPHPLVYTQTKAVELSASDLAARRVLQGSNGGPFEEAYKILRTQILHRLREQHWNVIGVTSPGRQEGKTLVAVNLSISMAMEANHTVILVDGNLRSPRVHELLGLENRGLADFLLENIPISDLLIHPQIDRLVVMPAGGPLRNSVESLTLSKMTSLVEEMKHRYASRVVVFDLPPLLDTADVIGFAPQLDAVLLVVEEGRTTEQDVTRALSILDGKVPMLGTVLNKAGKYSGGVSA